VTGPTGPTGSTGATGPSASVALGPIYPRGLSNAGPSSSFSPGAQIPVGAVFTMQAAGACNLVFDPTTFTRGAPGETTLFGPFVWGVRSGGELAFQISVGRHPIRTPPPYPADVFRYDLSTGMLDVIECNDVGPNASLAGASPAQGDIVVDATGTAWTIEQTNNLLVKIQSEPPEVAKTYPIPNSGKNLLAYDSVNNALVLLSINNTGAHGSPVLLATFDIATETFSADVSIVGVSPNTFYQSLFYTPVAGAPNGGYVFVGGATGGTPPPSPFDVFMLDPVTLATVAAQTGLVGSGELCPTGFAYLADAGKLFVSIGTQVERFTVGVGTLTFDTNIPVSDSDVLAGMATASSFPTFVYPADIYYDSTTNLVWVADQDLQQLIGFNANTKAIAFNVDLSALPWGGEGANRVIGDGTNVYALSEFNSPLFVAISQATGAIVGYGQVSGSFAEDFVIGGPDQLFVVSSNGFGGANNVERFSIAAVLAGTLGVPATPAATTPVTQSYSCVTYDPSGPFVYAGTEGQTPSELINQLDPTALAITNTLTYSAPDFSSFQRLLVADGSVWASTNDASVLRVDIATFPASVIDIPLSGESFIDSYGLSHDSVDDTILVGDNDNGAIYRIAASGGSINTQVSLIVPSPLVYESNAAVLTSNATPPAIWALAAFPQPSGSGPGYLGLFTTPVGSETQTDTIYSTGGRGLDILWVTDLGQSTVFRIDDPASPTPLTTPFHTPAAFNGDTNSIVSTGLTTFLVASDTLDELYPMTSDGAFTNTIDIAGWLAAIDPGADGQVLTAQGPGALPVWASPAAPVPTPTVDGQILTAIGPGPSPTWATPSRDNGFAERLRRRNWLAQGARPNGAVTTINLPTPLSDGPSALAGIAVASIGTYVFVVGQTGAGAGELYGVDTLTGLPVSAGALFSFGDSPTTLIGYRGTSGNSAQDYLIAICPNTGTITLLQVNGQSPNVSVLQVYQTTLPGALIGDNPSYVTTIGPSGLTGAGPTLFVAYYNAGTGQLAVLSGNGAILGTPVAFFGIIGKPVVDDATGLVWVPEANSTLGTIFGYQVSPTFGTITEVASFNTNPPLSVVSSGLTIYDTIFDGRYLWVLGQQSNDLTLVAYDLATATTGTPVEGPVLSTFFPISGIGALSPNLAFDGQVIYVQTNGVAPDQNFFAIDPDTGYTLYEYTNPAGTAGRSIVVLDSMQLAIPLFNGATVSSLAIYGPTYEDRNLNSLTLTQPLHNTTALGKSLPVTTSPANPVIGQMAFVDLTGGTIQVNAPAPLQDGTWGVKDWKYLAAGGGPFILIPNPGNNIEDPNNLGVYTTANIEVSAKGQVVEWMSPDGATWTIIQPEPAASGGGGGFTQVFQQVLTAGATLTTPGSGGSGGLTMASGSFTATGTKALLNVWFDAQARVEAVSPFLGIASPVSLFLEYSLDLGVTWLPTDSYCRVGGIWQAQFTNAEIGSYADISADMTVLATGITVGQTVEVRARLTAPNGLGTIVLDGLNPGFITVQN
jgi:hypothetical protein